MGQLTMRCFALRISAGLASTPRTGLVAALPPRLGPALLLSLPLDMTGKPYPAAKPLLDVGLDPARDPGAEPLEGLRVGKLAIGRGRGVEGIMVIPHPVPPGVRALDGPGVRAPHPPGEEVFDGLSR